MLGVRLEPELEARLGALAESTGQTKSEIVREAVRRFLEEQNLVSEARRQSLLASASDHAGDEVEFDQAGWK